MIYLSLARQKSRRAGSIEIEPNVTTSRQGGGRGGLDQPQFAERPEGAVGRVDPELLVGRDERAHGAVQADDRRRDARVGVARLAAGDLQAARDRVQVAQLEDESGVVAEVTAAGGAAVVHAGGGGAAGL